LGIWSLVFGLWSLAERDISFATIWYLAHWRFGVLAHWVLDACLRHAIFFGFSTFTHLLQPPVISKPLKAVEKSYDVSSEWAIVNCQSANPSSANRFLPNAKSYELRATSCE
jgi:hypothetical protein